MITVKNLSKYYDDLPALDHLNLKINRGITGLLGPNGAGKTTLLAVLNGLTPFQSGSVEIFGLPLAKNLKEIRRRCSFVPQSLALYEELSVMENLRFFAAIQKITGRARRENIDYAITVNQLRPQLGKKVKSLSGGQKRRLNIALSLLNNPQILYLDEPTVGIDPESRLDILEMIKAFKEDGKTIIYTSHYLAEIEEICDEAAIIDRGRLIAHGRIETLRGGGSDFVTIELIAAAGAVSDFAAARDDIAQLNKTTIKIESQQARRVGEILRALEQEGIMVKQITYGAGNLESLFIRLTSHRHEGHDV